MDLRACLTAAELRSISFNIRLGAGGAGLQTRMVHHKSPGLIGPAHASKKCCKRFVFPNGPHSGVLPIQAF